ncbi:MAG: DUF1569 domain-containing protein [Bacteroidota bacterium]
MKEIHELEDFLSKTSFILLKDLAPGTVPLWGQMNAQQMIEHLTLAVEVSSGKHDMQLHTEKEKVEKIKAIMLLSDRPMPKEFKNPALPLVPLDVKHKDIEDAKQALKQSLELFMHYFKNEVETRRMHNIFGELNYQEWLWFHYKHFTHHFVQFGLVEFQSRLS